MNKSKLTFAFALTFVMLLSSFAAIHIAKVNAAPTAAQGMTVNGELNSDYYFDYPYATSCLDIGFSMYGEMINSTVAAGNLGVGLQYPGYGQVGTYNQTQLSGRGLDPFSNEVVPRQYWVNGWLVNITYRDPIYEGQGNLAYRNVWAFATYSDGATPGGSWNNYMKDPTVGVGGRQCSNYAVTSPLQVLENGPRSFVGVATTEIYDNQSTSQWPLAKVVITINFDKVSKDVVLYKDVKLIINPKAIDGQADVELSNRGEWDMGPNLLSYSNFYPEWGPCSYGSSYGGAVGNMEQYAMKAVIDNFYGTTTATQDNGLVGWALSCPTTANPFVIGSESVFVNGTYQLPHYDAGGTYTIYTSGSYTYLLFPSAFIGHHSTVSIQYKNYIYDSNYNYSGHCGLPDAYSLAQIIEAASPSSSGISGPPGDFVGFAAYWPVLSSYTTDGWSARLHSLVGVTITSAEIGLPNVAFIIGQWDTMLAANGQFRGVTEYGLTDEHDGSNLYMASPYDTTYGSLGYPAPFDGKLAKTVDIYDSPIVDREVQYLLDAVFNPYNLNNAVEKDSTRWEILYNVSAADVNYAKLDEDNLGINLTKTNFLYAYTWDQYASFGERVIWGGALKIPGLDVETGYPRSAYTYTSGPDNYGDYWIDWAYGFNGQYYAFVVIPWDNVPAAGTIIEISFSTYTKNSLEGTLYATNTQNFQGIDEAGIVPAQSVDIGTSYKNSTMWTDYLGATFTTWVKGGVEIYGNTPYKYATNNETFEYIGNVFETWAKDITVYKESPAKIGIGDVIIPEVGIEGNYGDYLTFNASTLFAGVTITSPLGLDLYIDHGYANVWYDFYTMYYYNTTSHTDYFNTTVTLGIDFSIRDRIPGTYEWGIVGRDAQTIDSAGISMVTAAFKDKEVEFGYGGADMNATSTALMMPYVMSKLGGTGTTKASYADSTGRTALRDNYCPTKMTVPWEGYYWYNWYAIGDWERGVLLGSGQYWITQPISTSNIIVMGGYQANLAAYYANDFTSANVNTMTGTITAWSCWSKNSYAPNSTAGYAVISTYLDENGTVMFLIWGYNGRDSYWASQWFQTDGIFEFQNCTGFKGATSVVLQINYKHSATNPTFHIMEVLGTISETLVNEGAIVKGGIHPDP